MNYYNEHDNGAADWLESLIERGLIPAGKVDRRSIEDVTPRELDGYTQCHFFAGIGGWSYALQLAGWPADRPVWTGSCPCQPFSAAGKRKGTADERHLWPAFYWLISQCRPVTIFGEQVAGKAGESWFDIVSTDLAAEGYTSGLAVLPACGVGAPHIRKRLFWVANSSSTGLEGYAGNGNPLGEQGRDDPQSPGPVAKGSGDSRLANASSERRQQECESAPSNETAYGRQPDRDHVLAGDGEDRRMADANSERCGEAGATLAGERVGGGCASSPWADPDWLPCKDGKARPIEPGLSPLAHGISGRVVQLKGYGNAIVPQVAAEFIQAATESQA